MNRDSLNPIAPIGEGDGLRVGGIQRNADSTRKVMQWAKETKIPDHVEDKELYRACQGFEAYFARELMKKMRGDTQMMGGKGPGSEIYQGMFDDAIGDHIAASGKLGLADMMYRQIHENQGVTPSYPKDSGLEPINDEYKMDHWAGAIEDIAEKWEMDPDILRAITAYSSSGDPQKVDHTGGMGLTGITPAMQRTLGVQNPFDGKENLEAAARFFSDHMEKTGSLEESLSMWRLGPAGAEHDRRRIRKMDVDNYVAGVMDFFRGFKGELGEHYNKMWDIAPMNPQQMRMNPGTMSDPDYTAMLRRTMEHLRRNQARGETDNPGEG